jgi:hypothetical protein
MTHSFRLHRTELADVLGSAASIEPMLEWQSVEEIALYVCALGFEPRCLAIPEFLANKGAKVRRATYLEYGTNRADNHANFAQLTKYLSSVCSIVESLEIDDAGFVDRFRATIQLAEAESREGMLPLVLLDISVFANRAVFRCIKALLEREIDLRVVYAEAMTYRPARGEFNSELDAAHAADVTLGLEQGVGDIRISRDFPGQQLEQLPDCVILFPSFNAERSKSVLAKVDPALVTAPSRNVIWVIGKPPAEEHAWRAQAMRANNQILPDALSFEVSTFDYKETLKLLYNIYEQRFEGHNVTVSPLGSKMQALGVALFCMMHPDVRVIYSVPERYTAEFYSDGCKALWQIQFGAVASLRSVLGEVGKIAMVPLE